MLFQIMLLNYFSLFRYLMINLLIVGYKEQSMASQTTCRSRNFAPTASTSAHETSSFQVEVLTIDMTYHTREYHSLRYDKIYKIFNTGDFPLEDEDLKVYQNIHKSIIHLIVARLSLFPYNEETNLCFK
jgi:hypothetical protein